MKTVLYLLLSILLFHTAILAQNNPNNQINVYFLSGVSRSGINNSSATISDESISNFLSGYNIPATNVIPTFPAFNESDTFNVESGESSKQMNRAKIFTITLTDPTLKPTILNVLSNFSSVLYAESNGMTSTNVMPNDINYNQQWGLKNNNTTNADIHAEGAWDIFTGNPNSIIAIIDGGVDINHKDLSSKIDGGDAGFITETVPFIGQFSHGTHVAGIAAAITNNNFGVAGVDWQAKIHPMEAIGGNYQDADASNAIINSVNYSPYVWTLNNSWGTSKGVDEFGNSIPGRYSITLRSAFAYAYRNNRVSCVAMGNSNFVPGAGNRYAGITCFPAGFNTGLIAIGATDNTDNVALFSSRGNNIDVVAPGVGIYSTNFNNNYINLEGTSMATPFVTGLASLLKGFNTRLANDDIEHIIELTADDVNSSNNPGWDNQIGFGRINAQRALQAIQSPNSVQQLSTTGGTIFNISNTMTRAFLGVPNLADAYYLVKRIEIRKYVSFPTMCTIVDVWGRGVGTTGYREENGYCFGEGICEVVPGTLTNTGCTLRTWIYDVYTVTGQEIGYYPQNAANAKFQYTILGVPQFTINGDGLVCTSSNSYNIPNFPSGLPINWSVFPSGSATLSCSTCNNPIITSTTSSGEIELQANVNIFCANSSTITKPIHLGVPQILSNSGGTFTGGGGLSYTPAVAGISNEKWYPCAGYYVQSNLSSSDFTGATSTKWSVVSHSGLVPISNTDPMQLYFFASGLKATIRLTASNGCGIVTKDFDFVSKNCGKANNPCNHFAIARNSIAGKTVNVSVANNITAPCYGNSQLKETPFASEMIESINIYDKKGQTIKNVCTDVLNVQQTSIDLSDLPEGTYSMELRGLNGYKETQTFNVYSSSEISMDENIAQGKKMIDNRDWQSRTYVLQQQLYNELMTTKSDLADSSVILGAFKDSCSNSNLGFNFAINDLLQNNDTANATALLQSWTPANTIDNNSYEYYQYYLSYISGNDLSDNDINTIFALANQCPLVGGEAVNKARSLYNAITSENYAFDNTCGTISLPAIAIDNTGICVGGSTIVYNDVPDGVWASENTTIATVDADGNVTGISAGTTTIDYTAALGCGVSTVTIPVTVNALPNTAISGNQAVCIGNSLPLTAVATGGVWGSNNTSVATIDAASGVVTTVSAGQTIITYAVTDVNGCSASSTNNITVNALPDATITGTAGICINTSTTFTDATTGGTWGSSNTGVATIDAVSGQISAVSAGQTTIGYTVTDANGCTNSKSVTVSVNTKPEVILSASPNPSCAGETITYIANSSDPNATFTWTGSGATPVPATGTTVQCLNPTGGTKTFTVTATNGCGTGTKALSVVVNTLPSAPDISPSGSGNIITLAPCGTQQLKSSVSSGNQWYMDGNAISGATGQYYTGSVGHTYCVTTTNNNGCTSNMSVIKTLQASTFTMSPNPAHTSVSVQGINVAEIDIVNNVGTTVVSKIVTAGSGSSNTSLSVGALVAGSYTVVVKYNTGCNQSQTLIKY